MLYSLVESNCLMHMQTTVSIENFLFYFVAVAVYIDFFFFFPPFRTTNHRDSLDFSPNTFFSFVSFILLCTRFGSIDWFLIDCYYCPYANVFPIKHTRLLVIFLFLSPSLSLMFLFSLVIVILFLELNIVHDVRACRCHLNCHTHQYKMLAKALKKILHISHCLRHVCNVTNSTNNSISMCVYFVLTNDR